MMKHSFRQFAAVPFTRVTVSDHFWAPRIDVNRKETLPAEYRQLEKTGRIDAFRLGWRPGMANKPHIFWDSDVAKWIEAASYSLAAHPDARLAKLLESVASLIASAQQPDGYLNTYFTAVEPKMRWKDLRDNHALYCAGHLIEAAVAHYQATGSRTLIDAMCRYTDYIGRVFGRRRGQLRGYCGHEEIELALVKLYHATGEPRYLALSRYFIDERGRKPSYFEAEARRRGEKAEGHFPLSYYQAHAPVREQKEIVGHAVRAMYLYSAMADLAGETGDATLLAACRRHWKQAVERLLYVTGGIGSSRQNEGFTFDYDLPNEAAYCETCAAIGLIFWAHRMLQLDCDSRYADVMERALYNGVASGVSLDGKRFFYENPLASTGSHHRQDWFGCACCPPNIARLYASLGAYAYSESVQGAAVHLYIAGEARLNVAGQEFTLRQETNYPWEGRVTITLDMPRPARFALRLRQPGWCETKHLTVNGSRTRCRAIKGYVIVDRLWQPGDKVELDMPMPVTRVYADPRVRMDCGRVALQRGPVVYCIEGADNGTDLDALSLPADADLTARFEKGLLGGVVTIRGKAVRASGAGWGDALYRQKPPRTTGAHIKAIPYCTWDNRAPGEMLVWIREDSPHHRNRA
jgi:uncharacterized protein